MPTPKSFPKSLTAEIYEMLKSGEEVNLPGIGKLSVIQKAAREGRNPMTGDALTIAARKSPKFAPFGALKTVLNPSLL